MKKAKKLHVFLNNKTVSLDTILPFLADLKLASPSIKIIFFVFNKKTYEDIKANELLFELVCEFGKIEHFSLFANWAADKKYLRKFGVAARLCTLLMGQIFNPYIYFHFKALERFPFNLLYFLNKNNCFLFETNAWGHNKRLDYAYNILAGREHNAVSQKELTNYKKIVAYSETWPQLAFAREHQKEIFFINPTRAEPSWLDLCRKRSEIGLDEISQLVNFHARNGKKVVLYLFGTFGPIITVDEKLDGLFLLRRTLDLFKKIKNCFFIIKPHPNANLKTLERELVASGINNITISLMHVSVLSHYCNVAICNYMSFALVDAWFSGTTTVEFTRYKSKLLQVTDNQSTR